MTARMGIVAALGASFVLSCSSENHGTIQNPEGQPDAGSDGDANGDLAHCPGSPGPHRPEPIACAPSAGGLADQCTTDDQCPTGSVCKCSTDFYGNAAHSNSCIETQCRVDSDCGAGGTCSPSLVHRALQLVDRLLLPHADGYLHQQRLLRRSCAAAVRVRAGARTLDLPSCHRLQRLMCGPSPTRAS